MAYSNRYLRLLAIVLRVILGAIFVYAGWVKLKDPWELFALGISSYQILPLGMVEMVARTLPWLEVVVGVLLASGFGLRISATITTLLLVVFMALMIRAYVKGMEISCGCFGAGEVISWKTLLRDSTMLMASLFLTWVAFVRPRKTI
jgi:putative oxidoreductase